MFNSYFFPFVYHKKKKKTPNTQLFIIHGCYDFLDSHNRESLKRIKGCETLFVHFDILIMNCYFILDRMGIRTFIKFVKKMMRVYDYKRVIMKEKEKKICH